MGWTTRWAKSNPLQWGVFNAVGFFVAVVVVAGLNHHLTPMTFLLAMGLGLIAGVLATAGGYLARRITPS